MNRSPEIGPKFDDRQFMRARVASVLSWRWPRVLALTLILLGGVTWANIMLHGRSAEHSENAYRLNELDTLLHEESSVQWKTLAKGNSPVNVARELGKLRKQEADILGLRQFGNTSLTDQVEAYHAVLDVELGLLGVGKTAEALALEQSQTDLKFRALAADLAQREKDETDAADVSERSADITLIAAMTAAVIMIGLLLFRFEREHRASRRAADELLHQQRTAFAALAEHESLVRHQALHDPLTALPNRRALSELLATDGSRALLLVDLDDFKPVNDKLGHAAGDELLVSVAARLRSAVRADDTVARLGGDEFAVFLPDGDAATAGQIAARIVAECGRPFDLEAGPVTIGASVGVAVSADADGDTLLREADEAMYRIKQATKGDYRVASPTPG
jgi:diguanylate cyclase (GGDEF)-like protein